MNVRIRAHAALFGALLVAACGAGTTAPTLAPAPTVLPTASGTPNASPTPRAPAATSRPDLLVVAVGDSIGFNSADDCPGCIGFVRQYGDALAAATGKTVGVNNLTQHNGQTVQPLLQDLKTFALRRDALASADAIIVAIAHNDVPMNRDDDSCDGAGGDNPDWSKFTDACIAAEVKRFTPVYNELYQFIAGLHAGKPTILRTVNRYNDWNGWDQHPLSAAGVNATVRVIGAWNTMICTAAEAHGFICADISARFNGKDGTTPSGDLLGADYTHPSQKGNDAIAEVLVGLGFAPLVP